jgi:hypothetical protein
MNRSLVDQKHPGLKHIYWGCRMNEKVQLLGLIITILHKYQLNPLKLEIKELQN